MTIKAPPAIARAAAQPPKVVKLGTAVEVDTAMQIQVIRGPGGIESEEAVGTPEVIQVEPSVIEKLMDFRWGIGFGVEPGGGFRAYLQDSDTGAIIKHAAGDDFHDAWLNLAIDTQPPSEEVRRGPAAEQGDPRDAS